MPNFYSPDGNPEVWAERPEGYFTVEEWQAAHPAPPPPPPSLEAVRAARLADFDAVLAENDRKAVRPLVSGETALVARVNAAQAENRARRAQVAAATTVEEIEALEPVAVSFAPEPAMAPAPADGTEA